MLIKSLLELGKNLEGLFPEDKVHIRSLLTNTNEHFHSRIRAWREMPSLLEFLQRFTREVLEVAKRSASNVGFHVYTGKRSLHQRPDQRGTVWSKIVPETARHKPKPKLKRTSWAKLRERLHPLKGVASGRPRARTAMFKTSTVNPALASVRIKQGTMKFLKTTGWTTEFCRSVGLQP